jgi:uncharacterized protein (TIGR02596 family)
MEQVNPLPSMVRTVRGFSLIELLVVLAVVSILAVIAIPAMNSSMTSTKLTAAGQMISDTIGLARQEAVTKDRDVQVRFYNIGANTWPGWRAIQVLRVEPTSSGSSLVAVTKLRLLPDAIILSSTLSPMVSADPAVTGTTTLPIYGTATYGGFCFLPSGEVESALTTANNYVTVQSATAQGSPPANYSTLQVNLTTGKVTTYRP